MTLAASKPASMVPRNTQRARRMCGFMAGSLPCGGRAAGVEPALQDHRGGQLVDDLAPALARDIGGQQHVLGLDRGEALVDQLDRQRQVGGQRSPKARARRAASDSSPSGSSGRPSTTRSAADGAHHGRDGVQVAQAAVALDGGVRLGGQPERVGDRHADAARAEVDADDA